MNEQAMIARDEKGQSIVVISDIIFKDKRNIDWDAVEVYLQKYIGIKETVAETADVIHIGRGFPDEYKGSNYTKYLRGAKEKAKANATQGIIEMLMIASEKRYDSNKKEKHRKTAQNGWYYFTTRFALPIYDNEQKTNNYTVYSANLVVNHAKNGRLYLYDLVNIKKEASTPLKTIEL